MKTSGTKSPKAPRNTLKESVEAAEKLFKEAKRAFVNRETAAKAIGYSGITGSSLTLLASMMGYGLLVKRGAEVQVSDLAISILHPTNDGQKGEALKKAALNPSLFSELTQSHDECSEKVLESKLIQTGFAPNAAKKTASVFISNKEFANFNGADYSTGDENDKIKKDEQPLSNTLDANPSPSTAHVVSKMNPSVTFGELPIPVGDNFVARIPFPMSEEDFELFIGTLQLWKKKLIKKSRFPLQAIWKNKDHDKPVTITGEAGVHDGIKYYWSSDKEASGKTGVPETELEFQ